MPRTSDSQPRLTHPALPDGTSTLALIRAHVQETRHLRHPPPAHGACAARCRRHEAGHAAGAACSFMESHVKPCMIEQRLRDVGSTFASNALRALRTAFEGIEIRLFCSEDVGRRVEQAAGQYSRGGCGRRFRQAYKCGAWQGRLPSNGATTCRPPLECVQCEQALPCGGCKTALVLASARRAELSNRLGGAALLYQCEVRAHV